MAITRYKHKKCLIKSSTIILDILASAAWILSLYLFRYTCFSSLDSCLIQKLDLDPFEFQTLDGIPSEPIDLEVHYKKYKPF